MIMVHGILMTIGWGVFLQWGAFVARYARHRNPFWFYFHTTVQISGLCCSIAGFVFAVFSVQFDHFRFTHGILGLIVMILGILQPINAVLRPHKTVLLVDESSARLIWRWIHHTNGRLALLLALVNITLGVFLAVANIVIWALWITYLCLLFIIYFIVEILKRHQDRQQAKELFVKGNMDDLDQTRVGPSNYRVSPPMVEVSRL
ncbi:uncharacterized protein LOC135468627 [Liolophura sinensis]|uniref:uncharacterized protein LOC135468627 n=1 Tax=Liolophura sinensis TaxID=3198878 RepID=UPI0031588263